MFLEYLISFAVNHKLTIRFLIIWKILLDVQLPHTKAYCGKYIVGAYEQSTA